MRASLDGGTIHYVEKGSPAGFPVVFLHGFPFSHAMWQAQLDALAAENYRAIAYDIRGHGQSDVGDGQYTIEGHVDDLIAFLDHLKLPTTVIVGLSMGGYIALRALERNADRFTAAVLCDTTSAADSNEGKIKRAGILVAVKKKGSSTFADEFVKAVFAKETFTRDPAAIDRIRAIISHTPPLSIAGTLLALAARTDTTASLASITIPTLILVGQEDVTTPPSAARALHGAIKGSELHVLSGAAHMSNLENPAAFNARLLEFLGRVAPGR